MGFERELCERVECYGDRSAGVWNLVADIIEMCGNESRCWTRRSDDARRIPYMLYEHADAMRKKAQEDQRDG